jgi:hypothetical protein
MRVEFALDGAGLWWSGLGAELHVYPDRRAPGEPVAWSERGVGSVRRFRIGNLAGVVTRT